MYKRILVPLDGSIRAEEILPHVEAVAMRFAAQVIFMQVIESPHSVAVSPPGSTRPKHVVFEELAGEAENYLQALCDEFSAKGINCGRVLMDGPVVESIILVAERQGADLIAMASHGRSGLSRVFYGSVAAGVLQRVDRPLLIIRSEKA